MARALAQIFDINQPYDCHRNFLYW